MRIVNKLNDMVDNQKATIVFVDSCKIVRCVKVEIENYKIHPDQEWGKVVTLTYKADDGKHITTFNSCTQMLLLADWIDIKEGLFNQVDWERLKKLYSTDIIYMQELGERVK